MKCLTIILGVIPVSKEADERLKSSKKGHALRRYFEKKSTCKQLINGPRPDKIKALSSVQNILNLLLESLFTEPPSTPKPKVNHQKEGNSKEESKVPSEELIFE